MGSVLSAVTFIARLFLNALFIPELAVQKLFSVVPGELESIAIDALGFYAKYLGFASAITVTVLVYGLLGILFVEFIGRNPERSAWQSGTLCGFALWLFLSIAFLPLVGQGFFGLESPMGPVWASLSLLIPNLLYGAGLGRLHKSLGVSEPPSLRGSVEVSSKRLFIKRGIIGLVGLAILAYALDRFIQPMAEFAQPSPTVAGTVRSCKSCFQDGSLKTFVASEITPNESFYVVSKNAIDPVVDGASWSLTIDGRVERPIRLSYDELLSLPSVTQFATLVCISNPIGGNLIGNAEWTGVPLRYLLDKAGVKQNAKELVFHCADGYSTSIPIDRATGKGVILAYKMNGETLPKSHGFPLRAIIPGIYGMKNPKWIRRLEIVDYDYRGYWETRGWSNEATINTLSRIDGPPDGIRLHGKTPVAGIAFSGDRGISRVEVSIDGGRTWHDAVVKEPLSGYMWVLWAAEWEPGDAGNYRIMVRATDAAGNVQTAQASSSFPKGATGYHEVHVTVRRDG